jgi:hypothetical protein
MISPILGDLKAKKRIDFYEAYKQHEREKRSALGATLLSALIVIQFLDEYANFLISSGGGTKIDAIFFAIICVAFFILSNIPVISDLFNPLLSWIAIFLFVLKETLNPHSKNFVIGMFIFLVTYFICKWFMDTIRNKFGIFK